MAETTRRNLRLRAPVLLLALAVLATGRSLAGGAGGSAVWALGKAAPIAVRGGIARFTTPAPAAGSKTLVIVSSLATEPGPFRIRMTARPAPSALDPETVDDGESRPSQCPTRPEEPPESPEPGIPAPLRTFHLMVKDGDPASAANYRGVPGKLRALGRRVQVYVDERELERVMPDTLREIVATFDDRVFPAVSAAIGRAPDVDGDGRFTILVTGTLERQGAGRRAVDGFVRGADLDPDLAPPFGNRCDMLYLDAAVGPGPHLRTVLAHEYAHAVVAGLKAFAGPGGKRSGSDEEGWLDEAIAHLAEDLLNDSRSNLDYRISAFLSDPSRYRLVVDDYYAADLFRGHGNRGSTYLFLRWCADRYGPGLIGRLARSDRRGVAAIEAATGTTFASLFRRWSVALAAAGPDAPEDGFQAFDPHGNVGDRVLAGPRTDTLATTGDERFWTAAGTSPHYIVVEGGSEGSAAVAVEVTAPVAARLQVTAIPLPADLPRLELTACSRPGPDGTPVARVRIRERDGAAVRLIALAWEPTAFGASTLPALGMLEAATIPIPAGGPLVFKVVGEDALGRRVAGWADCHPTPAPSGTRGGGGE